MASSPLSARAPISAHFLRTGQGALSGSSHARGSEKLMPDQQAASQAVLALLIYLLECLRKQKPGPACSSHGAIIPHVGIACPSAALCCLEQLHVGEIKSEHSERVAPRLAPFLSRAESRQRSNSGSSHFISLVASSETARICFTRKPGARYRPIPQCAARRVVGARAACPRRGIGRALPDEQSPAPGWQSLP